MHTIPSRASNRVCDPERENVEHYIATYTPRKIPGEAWAEIGPVCRTIVRRRQPEFRRHVYSLMWRLAGFLVWARSVGLPVQEATLTPANVERYVATACPEPAAGSIRATLRAAGRQSAAAGWPQPRPLQRTRVSMPYSDGEIKAMWDSLPLQKTPMQREFLEAVLLLGLGAGLSASSMRNTTPECVQRGPDGALELHAALPDRVIPVREEYADRLERFAANRVGPLCGPERRFETFPYRLAPYRGVRLSVARLRTTWMTRLMVEPVPMTEVLRYAGLRTLRPLHELAPELQVSPEAEAEARRVVRGAHR